MHIYRRRLKDPYTAVGWRFAHCSTRSRCKTLSIRSSTLPPVYAVPRSTIAIRCVHLILAVLAPVAALRGRHVYISSNRRPPYRRYQFNVPVFCCVHSLPSTGSRPIVHQAETSAHPRSNPFAQSTAIRHASSASRALGRSRCALPGSMHGIASVVRVRNVCASSTTSRRTPSPSLGPSSVSRLVARAVSSSAHASPQAVQFVVRSAACKIRMLTRAVI